MTACGSSGELCASQCLGTLLSHLSTCRRQQLEEERQATMAMYERVSAMLEAASQLAGATELHEALQRQKEACKVVSSRRCGSPSRLRRLHP
jgi:hypothetical protein